MKTTGFGGWCRAETGDWGTVDTLTPVKVKKGFSVHKETQKVYPSGKGVLTVKIKELERLEIQLVPGTVNLSVLPVGSHLDVEKGVFVWQPGVGFVGSYQFDFLHVDHHGLKMRRRLKVRILPKH
ncbi:MAG: hypothetical protein GY765_02630 [bacterium]|nr:hypothetical protein [bacterium]